MECNCGNCDTKKMKRVGLNKFCSEFELKSIIMISNKINCTAQATDPRNMPEDVAEKQQILFLEVAFNQKAEAMYLRDLWWRDMRIDYDLPENPTLGIDFSSREFYILEEE